MFREVKGAEFPALEREVSAFWREREIFKKSLGKPSPEGEYVFYEGPPTANGQPALHHVLARSFKDLFPRFKSMQGYHVGRRGGWDTHGLPVEISVEKKLGLQGRNHDATREELETFNRLCRESVWSTIQDWNVFTERLGFWVDLDDAYITYENPYIESVWNLLKRLWARGLIAQDYKVVPLSPRIATTLSKAELGEEDSYREVDDPERLCPFSRKTGDDAANGTGRTFGARCRTGKPAGTRAGGLDDDALDAAVEHDGGGQPGADLRRLHFPYGADYHRARRGKTGFGALSRTAHGAGDAKGTRTSSSGATLNRSPKSWQNSA